VPASATPPLLEAEPPPVPEALLLELAPALLLEADPLAVLELDAATAPPLELVLVAPTSRTTFDEHAAALATGTPMARPASKVRRSREGVPKTMLDSYHGLRRPAPRPAKGGLVVKWPHAFRTCVLGGLVAPDGRTLVLALDNALGWPDCIESGAQSPRRNRTRVAEKLRLREHREMGDEGDELKHVLARVMPDGHELPGSFQSPTAP